MAEPRTANPGSFFAKVLADQHYEKGLEAERQGDWERALASYRRACATDAHSVLFLLARGHVCQAHGLDPEAEACYARVLELRPDDTVALYNQAQLFAARGELEAARRNLARIAAGDVHALGERATLVFNRLGDIALRATDYAAATRHFHHTLEAAPDDRYAAAALAGLPRFAEFQRPFDDSGHVDPKIACYAYAGTMLLGLPGTDDGIAIPLYPPLGFESIQELAGTLARFVGLARHFGWRFDYTAALDNDGQPVAAALAAALESRFAPEIDAVPVGASSLAVTAMAADPAALAARVASLRARSEPALTYAVGLAHPVWEYSPPVDVASLPVRLEFPWNRAEAAAVEHAEAFGAELAAALLAAPAAPAETDRQVRWYDEHHRLCFDPATAACRARYSAPESASARAHS